MLATPAAIAPGRRPPVEGTEPERRGARRDVVDASADHRRRSARIFCESGYDGAHSNLRIPPMKRAFVIVIALCAAGAVTAQLRAQTKPKLGEWATYGGDLASTRYSPLDQINMENFGKLEVAWRFKTDFLGPRPEFNFQST